MPRKRSAPQHPREPDHPTANDDRVVWTVQETSARLGLPVPTIYAYIKAGVLPAIRLHRRLLIPRDAVMALVNEAMREWDGPDGA